MLLAVIAYIAVAGTASALIIRQWNTRASASSRPGDLLIRALVAGFLWPVLLVILATNAALNAIEGRKPPVRVAASALSVVVLAAVLVLASCAGGPSTAVADEPKQSPVDAPRIIKVYSDGRTELDRVTSFRVPTGDSESPYLVCVRDGWNDALSCAAL